MRRKSFERGDYFLTRDVKKDILRFMVEGVLSFLARICLILAVCLSVWRFVRPESRQMRILRAFLLVIALIAVLAFFRSVGV